MSPTNMLELEKLVLENLYEDKFFFTKELVKAFNWLNHEELYNLYNWTVGKFDEEYRKIIDFVYSGSIFRSQINTTTMSNH